MLKAMLTCVSGVPRVDSLSGEQLKDFSKTVNNRLDIYYHIEFVSL